MSRLAASAAFLLRARAVAPRGRWTLQGGPLYLKTTEPPLDRLEINTPRARTSCFFRNSSDAPRPAKANPQCSDSRKQAWRPRTQKRVVGFVVVGIKTPPRIHPPYSELKSGKRTR